MFTEDSEDDLSQISDTVLDASEDIKRSVNEIVNDLTVEEDVQTNVSNANLFDLNGQTPIIKPRAYQIEMLEESLRHNIIVAVSLHWSMNEWGSPQYKADTGSGKTLVLVWFHFNIVSYLLKSV